MAFYNDKWVVVNMDEEEILLLRRSDKDILIDRIGKDNKDSSKEFVIKDVLDEYDVGIGIRNQLYIIYQNKDMNLMITTLGYSKREDIKLTSEPIPEVIDLNIIVRDEKIHIVYLIKNSEDDNKYKIIHNYYDGKDWKIYIVEDIISKKVLNPIKVTEIENTIILGYYSNDLEIGLRKFDLEKTEWSEFFKLVGGSNEKLYIELIVEEGNIHLAYCEFQEGNLIIKYEKFNHLDKTYEKELEKIISNKGSLSHPTIIIYENRIWIIWIELDKVMSRVSHKDGRSWSESIYSWDKTRRIDIIRYKYLSVKSEEGRILDYSFGSVYPEIRFLGFGNLEEAKEIPIKKQNKYLPRI